MERDTHTTQRHTQSESEREIEIEIEIHGVVQLLETVQIPQSPGCRNGPSNEGITIPFPLLKPSLVLDVWHPRA